MKNKEFIEEFALFASLSVSMIGVGVFYAPAIVAKYVGADSWISAIIAGIAICLILFCIYEIVKINKYKDITPILKDTYGGVLGTIISLIYSLVIIIVLAFSLRVFSEVITMYLLVNTPTLAIILLLTLPEANFKNLLPIGASPIQNYFISSFEMLFLFNGFSIAFILIPYVREKGKIGPILRRSSLFVGLFYVIIFILVSATLSSVQTAESIFPTITMLQSISSRSGFLEKWDGLVMSLWVIFYFTSFANIYYFASSILKESLNLDDIRTSSMIYVPIVYLAAMIPKSIIEVRNFKFGYLRIGFITTIIVVIGITLLLSYIKKRRMQSEE